MQDVTTYTDGYQVFLGEFVNKEYMLMSLINHVSSKSYWALSWSKVLYLPFDNSFGLDK